VTSPGREGGRDAARLSYRIAELLPIFRLWLKLSWWSMGN
jgi:hypothetical protein